MLTSRRMLSILFFMTFATLVATPGWTRDPPKPDTTPNWTVQVDPLTTVLGFVHVQVERAIGDHFSIYAGPHLRLFSSPFSDAEDFTGIGAELGVRWYMLGGAPKGWWALLRGVGAHLYTDDNTALGGYVSGLGGYTWILWDRLVLAAGAGVQYLHYTIDDLGPSGIAPAAHTTVGFAF